ncbi:transcriptional regulator, LysR family [Trichinella spiralis]|uniref:transcriptional regulator, LysR family n=1 Tax=Trichinella spiralis TaxID=6334 RepID=UPI0001EFC62E|nr:transcriptional regulator, LysR family [Trichinella spiralis]
MYQLSTDKHAALNIYELLKQGRGQQGGSSWTTVERTVQKCYPLIPNLSSNFLLDLRSPFRSILLERRLIYLLIGSLAPHSLMLPVLHRHFPFLQLEYGESQSYTLLQLLSMPTQTCSAKCFPLLHQPNCNHEMNLLH